MDELQLLAGLLKDLPAMALWVIAGFWVYKVVFIGSVYGVVRLAINKLYLVFAPRPPVQAPSPLTFANKTIDATVALGLQIQIMRIANSQTSYIHSTDITKLQEALDDYFEKQKKKK